MNLLELEPALGTATTPQEAALALANLWEKHPETRTQDSFARDSSGRQVAPQSIRATCFCAMGVVRFLEQKHGRAADDLYFALHLVAGNELVAEWNDTRPTNQAVADLRAFATGAKP